MKDGILNIYKPKNMTSFDVVAILRSALKIKKIGHTGTLDPDATGVLPVCIGKATKLVSLLENTDKTYRAVMLLGKRTDTQDISGEVLEEMSAEQLAETLGLSPETDRLQELLEKVCTQFTGEIRQIPPMYSALKVNGVKLVDAARRGQTIERKPRPAMIYEFRNLCVKQYPDQISFEVRCGKGTYIRTLCEDIGKALGVPACLLELERTEASGLKADTAIPVMEAKALAAEGRLEQYILPVDSFLQDHKAVVVSEEGKRKVLVGNFLYPDDLAEGNVEEGSFRIYDLDGGFYALYRYDAERGCLRPEKMFL